ncbi:hypothetical protein MLD52_14025 [Puniceicoccaceae bacterium K14]|nr:hypothetical protein [Puniceicoccaceae bacterium K14]
MADKNLTNALFTLKEKDAKASSTSPKPKKEIPTLENAKPDLPYRKRSFDSFFVFSVILLAVTLLAQVISIVYYS